MGEVYRAQDTRLDRLVAVKVLHPEIARDFNSRQRLEREARAVSRLNLHTSACCTTSAANSSARTPTDLTSLWWSSWRGNPSVTCWLGGFYQPRRSVRHGLEIAAALEEAHGHGVAHGDLKPGNIMITRFGLKLLDFGLARQLAVTSVSDLSCAPTEPGSGIVAGTVPYMAPEMLRGAACDARSDVWALGNLASEVWWPRFSPVRTNCSAGYAKSAH